MIDGAYFMQIVGNPFNKMTGIVSNSTSES
jgi:hypothetical protein